MLIFAPFSLIPLLSARCFLSERFKNCEEFLRHIYFFAFEYYFIQVLRNKVLDLNGFFATTLKHIEQNGACRTHGRDDKRSTRC